MDNPQVETVPRPPRRPLWLISLVPLAALVWAGFAAHQAPHQNSWQQRLDALQDDGSRDPVLGFSPYMSDVLIVRGGFLISIKQRQPIRLSPAQDRLLTACLKGPVDERSQSMALDTLILARRAGALSPAQARNAVALCLGVLRRTPPPMVRLEGARLLWHFQDLRGIPALRLLQNDPSPKIRDAAQQGLAAVSPAAPP